MTSFLSHLDPFSAALGAGVVVVVGVLLYRSRMPDDGRAGHASSGFPKATAVMPDDLRQELLRLKASGHTIDAIKQARKHMSLGLNDAKHLVDNLE